MERLMDIVKNRPLEHHVSLAFSHLSEIATLLPHLSSLSNLATLELQRNSITALPADMSALTQLATLDISENPFSGVQGILRGLKSLPALRHLNITLRTDSDEEAVIMALPQLETLNGVSLAPEMSPASKSTEQRAIARPAPGTLTVADGDTDINLRSTLSQPVIDAVSKQFNTIKAVKQTSSAEDEKIANQRFDAHLKECVGDFQDRTTGVKDPFVRHAEVLRATERLYDICFADVIDATSMIYPDLGRVLEQIRKAHQEIVAEVPIITKGLASKYSKEMSALQEAVKRSDRETSDLLEAAEALEQESRTHLEDKKALNIEFEKERSTMVAELNRLKKENDRLNRALKNHNAQVRPLHPDAKQTVERSRPRTAPGNQDVNASVASAQSTSSAAKRTPHLRNLSLKQLKDIIKDIYESKVRFDKKCAEAHLPRETMEQHLYTYLNQKYGLKALIVEWASAIIHGIKKYSDVDNHVAVFGAILRNEIDEEFRFVQKQLTETVAELLRVYLRGKFPLKTEGEITTQLKRRQAGDIHEDEWVDIVKYMYNQEDSIILVGRIKDRIRRAHEAAQAAPQPARLRQPREHSVKKFVNKIKYSEFVKTLLDFQLQGHLTFLHTFHSQFALQDVNKNGILDEPRFRALVLQVNSSKGEKEILDLLNSIDPYNNQQITYSECVTFLSQDIQAAQGRASS